MLARALEDPAVQRIAQSMRLNLQDSETLNRVVQMSQQFLDCSHEVNASQKAALLRCLNPGDTSRARHAIHAYREVSALN